MKVGGRDQQEFEQTPERSRPSPPADVAAASPPSFRPRLFAVELAGSVAMAEGKHPFPFRTRQLSPPAPMVLPRQRGGRVGRRRALLNPVTGFRRRGFVQTSRSSSRSISGRSRGS